jgi:integrase
MAPKPKGSYFQNNIPIMDGAAFLFTIPQSNGVWQFRTWVDEENRQFRKSLRTKDLDQAMARGRETFFEIMGATKSGKKLFGEKFSSFSQLWLEYQQERVDAKKITQGRHSTLKTQINRHIVPFIEEELGKATRIGTLDRNSFFDYGLWRKKKNPDVQDITIRNETTTIGSLIKYAAREGYVSFDNCEFEEIKIREVVRRDAFTDGEYERLYMHMRKWVKTEPSKQPNSNMMPLKKKQFMRDCVLLAANSLMRVGEIRQLKWGMVKKIFKSGNSYYAEIHLPAEICKNRKNRNFVSAGGEYLNRIKTYSNFIGDDDFVFCNNDDGQQISKSQFYLIWNNLLETSGIDVGERNLTFYSLRHYGITGALLAGKSVYEVKKIADTSVSYIESHYEHIDMTKQLAQAKMRYRLNKEGFVERYERS